MREGRKEGRREEEKGRRGEIKITRKGKRSLNPSSLTPSLPQDTTIGSTTQFLRFNTKPAGSQAPPGMRVFDRVLDFPCIFNIKVGVEGGREGGREGGPPNSCV